MKKCNQVQTLGQMSSRISQAHIMCIELEVWWNTTQVQTQHGQSRLHAWNMGCGMPGAWVGASRCLWLRGFCLSPKDKETERGHLRGQQGTMGTIKHQVASTSAANSDATEKPIRQYQYDYRAPLLQSGSDNIS